MKSSESGTKIPVTSKIFFIRLYFKDAWLFIRSLNQLRVFVSRSRHKCWIGLNRERIFWNFNKETDSVSTVNNGLFNEIR